MGVGGAGLCQTKEETENTGVGEAPGGRQTDARRLFPKQEGLRLCCRGNEALMRRSRSRPAVVLN